MKAVQIVAKTAAVAVLVTTAASGFAFALVEKSFNFNSVDISSQLGNRPTKQAGAEAGAPINVLLIGSDTREGQGTSFGGSKYLGSQRGDTVILVHLSGDRKWATAVSIPRDTYIAMPDCKLADGKISKGWSDKFNVAYSRGGAACVITTLEQLTGLYIDHYAVVDFTGFIKVVDAVGGVQVCVTQAVNDPKSKLKLPAGTSQLNGTQAIAFVRARKTLGDGSDLSRIRRQQDFLASLAKKMISAQTLLNPVKLVNVISSVSSALTTDPGLGSLDGLKQFALNLTDLRPSNIRFITAPNTPAPGHPADVVLTAKADELWAALRADQQWPAPPDNGWDGQPLTVQPSDISVQVLNGTTTSGLAGKKGSELRGLGYRVKGVANADAKLFGKVTAVYATAKQADAARTLAKALGLTEVKLMPKGQKFSIAVVVGSDWKSPVDVKVKSKPIDSIYAPTEGRAADETTCSPA